MRKAMIVSIVIGLIVLSTALVGDTTAGSNARILQIRWQRLVDEKGQTCGRCGATEASVAEAFEKLSSSLAKLDIEVALEKKVISPAAFSKDPLESNRIWIAGKPLEEWLAASFGKSQCSSSCGKSECRTVIIDKKTYESIPAELIVKAGLLAAAQIIADPSAKTCSPSCGQEKHTKSNCCQQTKNDKTSACQEEC